MARGRGGRTAQGGEVSPAAEFDRLFHVANGANLTLKGLTIENGNAQLSKVNPGEGGGILQDAGSTLDIEECVISGNTAAGTYDSATKQYADGQGGAIVSNGSLTIRNSTITGNSGVASGGGISVQNGTLDLENSTVSGNTVNGGFYFYFGTQYFIVANGGGLALENSSATIENSTFSTNKAGAASYAQGGADLIDNH